jgi:membrane protease YdiL (CAAX protease family)
MSPRVRLALSYIVTGVLWIALMAWFEGISWPPSALDTVLLVLGGVVFSIGWHWSDRWFRKHFGPGRDRRPIKKP